MNEDVLNLAVINKSCKSGSESLNSVKMMSPDMALELSLLERDYVQRLLVTTSVSKRRLYLLQWAQQVENEVIFFEEIIARDASQSKEHDS